MRNRVQLNSVVFLFFGQHKSVRGSLTLRVSAFFQDRLIVEEIHKGMMLLNQW